MIEGNLEDISLPGLLQLLAAESTKNYRLRITKGGQHGDMFVCEGHLLVATYGILEGLDAVSEFLSWSDGEFVVEKLPSHFKSTIRSNINLNLSEPGCFSDQCAFLYESNVGLNTEIVPSRSFGTAEWQEALHVQPLGKEDYVILGWITDGRTMRQAMREFQFDLKTAIGVLYRLLITRSVEVVRPTAFSEPDDLVKLATRELKKHTQEPPPRKTVTVEFHATDIGGARSSRPRGPDDTLTGLREMSPAASSNDGLTAAAEPAIGAPAGEAVNETVKKAGPQEGKQAKEMPAEPANRPLDKPRPARPEEIITGEMRAFDNKPADEKLKAADTNKKAAKQPVAVKEPAQPERSEGDSKRLAKADGNLTEAMVDDAAEVKDSFKKQLKKTGPHAEVAGTPGLGKKTVSVASPAAKGSGSKLPHQTQDLPAVEPESPLTRLSEAIDDELEDGDEETNELKNADVPDANKVLNVVASAAPPGKQFDERRTDPLPLISIDIERLLNSTFQLTNIGTRALSNTSLDELLKQVLLDVERGKSLLLVLTDSNRSESAVLATYRYCLDRGYIEHSDSVMGLTVDLLLGRLEMEQYLLQRRRITGDQLRDMVAISQRQGISLDKLLVAAGYMLPVDMERVRKEKERFCPR